MGGKKEGHGSSEMKLCSQTANSSVVSQNGFFLLNPKSSLDVVAEVCFFGFVLLTLTQNVL